MNLLDKYVAEIGKHLPPRGRTDIEAEIRSTLEDMLEERDQASLEDEAAVIALLKEYGSPREVAESYTGPRYLIGPLMYPRFKFVAKIVLGAVFIGLLVASGVNVVSGSMNSLEISQALINFVLDYFGAAISALGFVILTFAVLERALPGNAINELDENEWDPDELVKESDPDEIKLSEPIATIIFTLIGLIIINFYPDVISFRFVIDGERIIVPILSDAFFLYLPWINVLGLIQIAFSLYLLRQSIWTIYTRLGEIAIGLATIALAIFMLRGPSLVNLGEDLFGGRSPMEISDGLIRILDFVPGFILLIIIFVTAGEISQTFYRLFKRKPVERYPVLK